MTVKELIRKLEKMPPRTHVAIDISETEFAEWDYQLTDLSPRLVKQVNMHPDWVNDKRGRPRYLNMCVLGTIVGSNLE